ncbi:hypothetical protein RR46_06443 [Papilio xuthus]|uniref:Uncharacterized protein n=1 Tax=Papilio xuthus TaxID=66420 RepID=A0A194QCU3_PAPXU|nr:hypothetical protein RR46_06443 [Papilio xuthus]
MESITKKLDKIKSEKSFDESSNFTEEQKESLKNDINFVEDNLNVTKEIMAALQNEVNTVAAVVNFARKDIEHSYNFFTNIREHIENILNRSKNLEQELKNEKAALKLNITEKLGMENPIKRLEITSSYGEFFTLSKILSLENKVELLESELKNEIREMKRDIKVQNMKIKLSNEENNKAIDSRLQGIERQYYNLKSKISHETGAKDSLVVY